MRAACRRRSIFEALALFVLLAAPSPAQFIEIRGIWLDASVESEEPGLAGTLSSLATPLERLQRSLFAQQLVRDNPPTIVEAQAAEAQLRQVDELVRSGDPRAALIAVRDALALYPTYAPLLSRGAIVASLLRDYERADHYFSRYLELNPDDVLHLAGRAGVLIRLSRLDEAEQLIRRGLQRAPELLPLRFHEATLQVIREVRVIPRTYWRRRSLEEVVLLLNWLITDREELERQLGVEDFRRLSDTVVGAGLSGQLEEARKYLIAAQQFRAAGKFAEARAAIEMVVNMGAEAYGLRAAVAELLLAEGRTGEGLAAWERLALDFGDWAQPWLSRGQYLMRADRLTEAILSLRRAQELLPRDPLVRFVLACALALSGAKNEAQQIFNELVLADPARTREWMESDPLLEKALRSVPNSPNYLRVMGVSPETE